MPTLYYNNFKRKIILFSFAKSKFICDCVSHSKATYIVVQEISLKHPPDPEESVTIAFIEIGPVVFEIRDNLQPLQHNNIMLCPVRESAPGTPKSGFLLISKQHPAIWELVSVAG